ncbi:Uncharacterised protein [Xylophilus ampelinus]|nr:Uncharacterised protein [Xylophilus ampelinus]
MDSSHSKDSDQSELRVAVQTQYALKAPRNHGRHHHAFELLLWHVHLPAFAQRAERGMDSGLVRDAEDDAADFRFVLHLCGQHLQYDRKAEVPRGFNSLDGACSMGGWRG